MDKNIPFYIGIGSDGKYKRAYSKHQRGRHWNAIKNKTEYEVEIMLDNLTWDEACKKEIEFIALYGRSDKKMGPLVNQTDGGDGAFGVIVSEETRKKISDRQKGKVFSEEHKKNLGLKAKGRKYSAEYVKEMSRRAIGRKYSDERNNQISQTLKYLYASGERTPTYKPENLTAEGRRRISECARGRTHTEESKRKISEKAMGNKRNLGKPRSEETKKRIGDANRGRKHTEETKLKNSLAHKGRTLTEEQKKKISIALKGKKKQRKPT